MRPLAAAAAKGAAGTATAASSAVQREDVDAG
jgi:hypothetical protein